MSIQITLDKESTRRVQTVLQIMRYKIACGPSRCSIADRAMWGSRS